MSHPPKTNTEVQARCQNTIARLVESQALPYYKTTPYQGGANGNFFWIINIYEPDAVDPSDKSGIQDFIAGPMKLPQRLADTPGWPREFYEKTRETLEKRVIPFTATIPALFIVVTYHEKTNQGIHTHNQSLMIPLRPSP